MKLKIFLLIAIITNGLASQNIPFILSHDGLIDQRAQDKINQIGLESKTKLNVNLHIFIKENNGINLNEKRDIRIEKMKKYEQRIVENLKKPYAVLTIFTDQMHANIILSDSLKDIVDRDDILDGYVIPLLASKDKNSLFAKTSASCLNGYAQIADSIADSKNIKLESSIGSEGKITGTIMKVFMYTLVITGIVLYTVVILREKKYKKLAKKELEKNGK